jgi:hypothetical protein
MYFSYFIFNKSKAKTIILIHGAYGTAGYWLPYLNLFNNYKIIVFNMNYSAILNSDKDLNITKLLLEKFVLEQNLIAVISHSLGTIFSNFFSSKKQVLNFNICPMVYSKKINSEKFNIELQSNFNPKNIKLKTNINLINNLIEESKKIISTTIFYFTPILDNYFIYDFPLEVQKIEFKGDHFRIENAINMVVKEIDF